MFFFKILFIFFFEDKISLESPQKGLIRFTKGEILSDNFPTGNFPKFRSGPLRRYRLQSGPSAASTMGKGQNRPGGPKHCVQDRSCRLGNCTFGKFSLGKNPLEKYPTSNYNTIPTTPPQIPVLESRGPQVSLA